jgi:hypothetical protein
LSQVEQHAKHHHHHSEETTPGTATEAELHEHHHHHKTHKHKHHKNQKPCPYMTKQTHILENIVSKAVSDALKLSKQKNSKTVIVGIAAHGGIININGETQDKINSEGITFVKVVLPEEPNTGRAGTPTEGVAKAAPLAVLKPVTEATTEEITEETTPSTEEESVTVEASTVAAAAEEEEDSTVETENVAANETETEVEVEAEEEEATTLKEKKTVNKKAEKDEKLTRKVGSAEEDVADKKPNL